MRLTAQDLHRLGVIDAVIEEPIGGAHRNPATIIAAVGDAVVSALKDLKAVVPGELRQQRRTKFLEMGKVGLS